MKLTRATWTTELVPLVVFSVAGCLDPLPESTICEEPKQIVIGEECVDCPLPPVTPYRQCIPFAFAEPTAHLGGCLAQFGEFERFSCLVGESWEAECQCGQPLPETPACYTDDCPLRVTSVATRATCLRDIQAVSVETINEEVPDPECYCRCPSEILRCDGRGLAFGALAPENTTISPLGVVVTLSPSELPDSGRLGVYLQARGFGAPLLVTIIGPDDKTATLFHYFIGEMKEEVAFGPKEDGISLEGLPIPYEWHDAADRPLAVLIGSSELASGDLFVAEVDCVIPFYAPL